MQMKLNPQTHRTNPDIEQIATVLRAVSWTEFWLQLGLAIATGIMLMLAMSGRSFSRAVSSPPGVGVVEPSSGITPGIGIGIFWAICGVLVLLFGVYLAFRQTRFAKRLRHPEPSLHPKKADVLQALRLGAIVGLVGMLLTILGGGASLGVLLSKSIAQPQGVAIYDPNRIIRSLDVFVAMANMNGIAAHFVATVASLGLFNWLDRSS